jgi:hypothetical protein
LSCFSKEIEVLSFEDCGTLEKKKKEHVYEWQFLRYRLRILFMFEAQEAIETYIFRVLKFLCSSIHFGILVTAH